MEETYGAAHRIWVMDGGIVSEANIDFLRQRQARYLAGTPKSWLRVHEAALLEQTHWQQVQAGLKVRQVAHPDGEPGERYVLYRSQARAEKDRAMLARQSDHLTAELAKVDAWLRRQPQSAPETVGRHIGRNLGKYPAETAIMHAKVQYDTERHACGLQITSNVKAGQKAYRQKGATCCAPTARKPSPRSCGVGISNSPKPRPLFAPPEATWVCAQFSITKMNGARRTSWCASWRLPCGARSNNGYASGPGHLPPTTGQTIRRDKKRGRGVAGASCRREHRAAPTGGVHARAGDRATARPSGLAPVKRNPPHRRCSAECPA